MRLWVFHGIEDLDHGIQCYIVCYTVVSALEETFASVWYSETSLSIYKAIWSQDSEVQNCKTRFIFGIKSWNIIRRDERWQFYCFNTQVNKRLGGRIILFLLASMPFN